jgi:hypothetical protein
MPDNPLAAELQPALSEATISGLRSAVEILERVDYSPNAEPECSAPFAVGFAKSAIGWALRDLRVSPARDE